MASRAELEVKMSNQTPRPFMIGLFALGLFTLPVGPGTLQAEPVSEACLAAPVGACVDEFNARLKEIESTITDPEILVRAQMQRLHILINAGSLDEAEALISVIQNPPDLPEMKDEGYLSIIQAFTQLDQERGRRLLTLIKSPRVYQIARDVYLDHLVRYGKLDLALQEISATERDKQPVGYYGLQSLAEAAIKAGQTDTALRLIAENKNGDPKQDNFLLNFVVIKLVEAGQLDTAKTLLPRISDQTLRVISTAQLARNFATAGKKEDSDALFEQVGSEMYTIDDFNMRRWAFNAFATAAIESGQIKLAVEGVKDLGSFPLDQAEALISIVEIARTNVPEATWRPIALDAVALLEDSQRTEQTTEALDQNWFRVGFVFARAGDVTFAKDLMARIANEDYKSQGLFTLASELWNQKEFEAAVQTALDVLDSEEKVIGLLMLADYALESKPDLANELYKAAYGIVESPDSLDVTDDTISLLVRYEASIGQYDLAAGRLKFVKDAKTQTFGLINILYNVMSKGTQEEFDTYFTLVKQAVDKLTEPETRNMMTQALMFTLAEGNKDDAALALAESVTDPGARDALLSDLAMGQSRPVSAMKASKAISNPAWKLEAEHQVLLNALMGDEVKMPE